MADYTALMYNMHISAVAITTLTCLSMFFIWLSFISLVYASRHFILFMIGLEFFYCSIIVFFVLISFYLDNPIGQVYAIFLMCIAAAEAVVGFSLAISAFKTYRTLNTMVIHDLRG